MTAAKTVTKQLATMQDLAQGRDTVAQTRNSGALDLGKVDVPYAVSSIAALKALDVSVFTHARLYQTDINSIDLIYDAGDGTGLNPDTGTGSWFVKSNTPVVASASATGSVVNGGVWESGESYTSSSQFMIYQGVAYKVKTTTTLPYTIASSPDTSKVYALSVTNTAVYADLDQAKTAALNLGDIVETLEYTAGRGDGGCKYVVVAGGTGTEDGGKYINMTSGYQLQAIFETVIHASQYGIDKTGATTATATLLAIYSEAETQGIPLILLPAGTIYLATVCTFSPATGYPVVIRGVSKYKTTVSGSVGKTYHGLDALNANVGFEEMAVTGFDTGIITRDACKNIIFTTCNLAISVGTYLVTHYGLVFDQTNTVAISGAGSVSGTIPTFKRCTFTWTTAPEGVIDLEQGAMFDECYFYNTADSAGAHWVAFEAFQTVGDDELVFRHCNAAFSQSPLVYYTGTNAATADFGGHILVDNCSITCDGASSPDVIISIRLNGTSNIVLPKTIEFRNTIAETGSKFIGTETTATILDDRSDSIVIFDIASLGRVGDSFTTDNIVPDTVAPFLDKHTLDGASYTDSSTGGLLTTNQGNYITISSTTTRASLTAGYKGQVVRIRATVSVTISDNANTNLSGGANYGMTADDTLTLTYSGSNWYETGRSVN